MCIWRLIYNSNVGTQKSDKTNKYKNDFVEINHPTFFFYFHEIIFILVCVIFFHRQPGIIYSNSYTVTAYSYREKTELRDSNSFSLTNLHFQKKNGGQLGTFILNPVRLRFAKIKTAGALCNIVAKKLLICRTDSGQNSRQDRTQGMTEYTTPVQGLNTDYQQYNTENRDRQVDTDQSLQNQHNNR